VLCGQVHHELFILVHGEIQRYIYINYLFYYFSGIHHKKTCANESDIARWKETDLIFETNQKYLFPKDIFLHLKYEAKRPLKQTNGGWSDLRDRQLCLSFALNNPKDISHITIKT
jgi:hypothetical protein